MNVFVLGGSGRLGQNILKQLQSQGISTTALVREPQKLQKCFPNINFIKGTPEHIEDLKRGITACDVVINALNISRHSDFPWSGLRTPSHLISNTIKNLLQLMGEQNISRIVSVSAWGANDSFTEIPFWFKWVIKNSNVGVAYQDHERQEELLHASSFNWTILRPVGLMNGKKEEKVKLSHQGNPKPSLLINRKSVAHFIVHNLKNEFLYQKTLTLSRQNAW
jgi:uncharacterized protein YbjT (DUF2867 family)